MELKTINWLYLEINIPGLLWPDEVTLECGCYMPIIYCINCFPYFSQPMEVDSSVPEKRTTSASTQSATTVGSSMPSAQPRPERNGRGATAAAAVGGAMAAEPVGTEARFQPNWQAAVPEVFL